MDVQCRLEILEVLYQTLQQLNLLALKELEELLENIQNEKKKLETKIPIAVKISPDLENSKIEIIAEILIKYSQTHH